MTARSPMARVLVPTILGLLLGNCSSSPNSSVTEPDNTQTTTADTGPVATQPTSTSAPATAATTSASTIATTSPATDDTTAIATTFTTFFDGLDPNTDAKIAVLEHGDLLGSMIVDAAQDPQFQQLSTVVNSVTLLSDADCTVAGEVSPCALVGHDMFVGGLAAMVDLKSHAVRVDGVWKVSAASWCAIVAIGGAACPALPAG